MPIQEFTMQLLFLREWEIILQFMQRTIKKVADEEKNICIKRKVNCFIKWLTQWFKNLLMHKQQSFTVWVLLFGSFIYWKSNFHRPVSLEIV